MIKSLLSVVLPVFVCAALVLRSSPCLAGGTWNFNELTSVQGGLQVQTRSTGQYMAGFTWNSQKTEHVFFIGTDQHIHEFYHDTAWHHSDLTAASGDKGNPAGDLMAYVSEKDGTEHVFYVGYDFPPHIHELYYQSGKWHAHDLNVAMPTAALPGSPAGLTGYVFEKQNTQHVFYMSLEGIQELYYDGTWQHGSLGQSPGPYIPYKAITAYAAEYEGTEHVFADFFDGGAALATWEYWWNGKWNTTDIDSNFPGNPGPPDPSGQLVGYAWENTKTEHVFYMDAVTAHVHELERDASDTTWHQNDLSGQLVNRAWLPGWDGKTYPTVLSAFVLESEGTQHVYYLGINDDIWELYWDGSKWDVGGTTQYGIPSSLTHQFNPPLNFAGVSGSSPLVSFGAEYDKSEHVFFLSKDGKVCELYHTP